MLLPMRQHPLVLIADDDFDFQEVVATKLKNSGFAVETAQDGEEAVKKTKELSPDLILMDIKMPKEGGTEAVIDLKNNPAFKDTKIIFFTNLDIPWPGIKDEEKLAKELGAAAFLKKSINLDELVERIKKILNSKS